MSGSGSWTEGVVVVGDGARIHYSRRGNGPPVVLAHGVLDSGPCWSRVAEALERDYELIAYDARFHGRSDAPGDNAWHGVDDFVGLVGALGLDRPVAIGHSLGAATVAGALAAQPDLLRAAVLADPPWTAERIEASGLHGVMAMFREAIAGKEFAEVVAFGREINPGWTTSELEPWAASKLEFRGYDAVSSIAAMVGDDWRTTVSALRAPVLLVTGGDASKGRIVTPEVAAEAQRLAPQVEVVCIEHAGHNVQREGYDEFVGAVTEFLRRR
jgi:pimeloyl-ACP methyl ester carboxylesterase